MLLSRLSIHFYQGQGDSLSSITGLISALQNSSRQGNSGPCSMTGNREEEKCGEQKLKKKSFLLLMVVIERTP